MRVLVNALSVTNLSGRYVLLGHLSRLAEWTQDGHEFLVFYHNANRGICRDLGPNVHWIRCPSATRHWAARTAWEHMALPRKARKLKVDLYWTPSGATLPSLKIPQVCMALNPWAFVRRVQRTRAERLKARLQRHAYRKSVRKACFMAYISGYLRDAYRGNAGQVEKAGEIVYPGIGNDVFQAAAQKPARCPARIVTVSLMAPHKGIETVVEALSLLRGEHDVSAQLHLVGGWPDRDYERSIRRLVADRDLADSVYFEGLVSREELMAHYSKASVFCLMSWCESFGIPSVEAQAFGTPVVSSNCCAIPEVCGPGGLYAEPGDAADTAEKLAQVLGDRSAWERLSTAAAANADKYTPDRTSRPLMRMFELARRERESS